jgi:hypothetical protein
MTVDDLLSDAEYGISMLGQKVPHHVNFYFRSTLTCLRSVFDHLLEEYKQKFRLKELKETNCQSFMKAAKGNKQAEAFIDFYCKEMKCLFEKDLKFADLFGKNGARNVEIHSRSEPKWFAIKPNKKNMSVTIETSLERRPDDNLVDLCTYCLEKTKTFVSLIREKFTVEREEDSK